MLNRFVSLVAFVCLAVAAFGQPCNTPGASCLFQQPGTNQNSGGFVVVPAGSSALNVLASPTGPIGLSYVIAKPDGSKFYLVSPSQIQSIDGAFSAAPQLISGISGLPTAAAITPDGKTLVVGTQDSFGNGFLFLVDTSTNLIVGNGTGLSLPGAPNVQPGNATPFCPACFIAISQDSKTAYVLMNSGIGGRAAAVNLNTRAVTGQLTLIGSGGNSITLSPGGLLYVGAQNVIFEIDPSTFTFTTNSPIQVNGSPFRLHFTSDGTAAYMANLTPQSGGRSLIKMTLAGYSFNYWPANFQQNATPFDDMIVAGNNRVFAFQAANGLLADMDLTSFTPNVPSFAVGPGNNPLVVAGVAISNEVPTAQSLFMLVANGNQINLDKVNLATNQLSAQNLVANNIPVLQVVTVPPQTGPATFVTRAGSTNQLLPNGGAAAPLVGQVYDKNGLPVFNAPVTFTTDPTNGAVITNASTVTNANGWFSANVSVPNTCGTYNITATVGTAAVATATQIFSVTVPGNCTTTGNPQGGGNQVIVISGDGQIAIPLSVNPLPSGSGQTTAPLVVQVNDANGNPLPNIGVTFATNNPAAGGLTPVNAITDSHGQASTQFTAIQLPIFAPYLVNTITATAAGIPGNATFTVISLPPGVAAGQGVPQFNLITPSSDTNGTITAPEGSPVPNAIVIQILATAGLFDPNFCQQNPNCQAIPGVGLYLYAPNSQGQPDPTQTTPATCVGSSKSDATGTAHCTLVAACKTGNFQLGVALGNSILTTNLSFNLHVVGGVASQFNILAGNNQSGVAGQTVSGLTASLTDGCNTAVSGVPVTWTVKSGSATLVSTFSVTNGNGTVSTGVKFGSTPGQVVIEVATASGIKADFNLINNIVVSSVTAFSGSGQAALENQPFGNPLIVLVKDNNGNPVSGISVSWSVSSGSVTVGAASTNTGTNGQAQVSVNAGGAPGPAVITATAAGIQVFFNLTVKAPGPTVTATSFVNAASGIVGMVPCGLGTLTGPGIAVGIQGVISGISPFGPLPFTLGGFSMTVNNVQAPIQAIANINGIQQVNYQSPCETQPGNATVVVNANGATTTVTNVPVFAAQPGIFTFAGANGKNYAAIQSATNGSYVTPTNFAVRGQTYYVYVTGLNQTTPALVTDSAGIPNQNVNLQAIVAINGVGVPVVSAQAQEGEIGSYVIGFQIPLTAATGADQPFTVGVIVNGQNNPSLTVLIGGIQ